MGQSRQESGFQGRKGAVVVVGIEILLTPALCREMAKMATAAAARPRSRPPARLEGRPLEQAPSTG
jgi:hypothetical protein